MKLFIAIPSYTGNITAECMLSVVGLMEVLNSELSTKTTLTIHSYNGDVADARNELVKAFMSSTCTHLLFVDDDMAFVPRDIVRMCADRTDAFGNPAVTAALCPRRNTEGCAVDYTLHSPPVDETLYGTNGYASVDRVGTGIMFIPRAVFEHVKPNAVVRRRDGLVQYFLRQTGVEDISEDYAFCDLLKHCAVPLYIALWTDVKHIGRHAFGGFK